MNDYIKHWENFSQNKKLFNYHMSQWDQPKRSTFDFIEFCEKRIIEKLLDILISFKKVRFYLIYNYIN